MVNSPLHCLAFCSSVRKSPDGLEFSLLDKQGKVIDRFRCASAEDTKLSAASLSLISLSSLSLISL